MYISDFVESIHQWQDEGALFGYISRAVDDLAIGLDKPVDFLERSISGIEEGVDKWYESYMRKVDVVINTNNFIQNNNLTFEEDGYYALMEIDMDQSSDILYSHVDSGYILAPIATSNINTRNRA